MRVESTGKYAQFAINVHNFSDSRAKKAKMAFTDAIFASCDGFRPAF
jgi:hypothetical protein